VSPLLWRALTAAGSADGREQEDWARDLSADAARCRAQALLVLPRVGPAALAPLAAAGLTPLVFKGATLAGRYPDPGLRPMDDVDLVLPPEQLRAGVATLEGIGWRVVPVRQATHHEVILTHPDLPGLPVELHRALATWRENSNRLTTLDLWRWRVPGAVCGVPAFILPVEEEIVSLVAHAAKPFHVFDRLIWVTDIAVLLAGAPDSSHPVDWGRVEELADRVRCRTALAVALTQVERLGAASPPALRDCPARNARARALEPVLSAEWPVIDRTWSLRRRLRYALVDDWRQRLSLLAGQIIRYGPVAAPRHAVELSARGVRRWWRLRRDAARAEPDHRDGKQPAGL
jgi:hypothetical protein